MSIFDINESNWKMSNETDKIIQMFEQSSVAVLIKDDGEYDYSKAMKYDFFIDTVCLSSWKAKGTATTFAEFLSRIHYTSIKEKAHHDAYSFIQLIELVYNCYMLVENNKKPFESILVFNNPILKDILDYDSD